MKTESNPRIYGEPPYRIAVIHGGPGAQREMRPVAHRLGAKQGVLEPLQTAMSVDRQIEASNNIGAVDESKYWRKNGTVCTTDQ